jgi:hypothetical protein
VNFGAAVVVMVYMYPAYGRGHTPACRYNYRAGDAARTVE